MALASDKPMPHIPYRDATLTKMLKKVPVRVTVTVTITVTVTATVTVTVTV